MTLEDQIAPINPAFHRAVEVEMGRQKRKGYNPDRDDSEGVDRLLRLAYDYVAQGSTVKAGAMIIAARAWVQRNEDSNIMQRQVAEFMKRCDQSVAAYPQLPEDEIVTLRIRLMVEELLGKIDAPVEWSLDAELDHRYMRLLINNKSDELIASMVAGDLVGVADGIVDVLYVVIGTAVAYGINIQEVFNEVHRSNLSKTVWSEELRRYTIEKDEFGKGIKPPTYSPAALAPIVQRQIDNGKIFEYYEYRISDEYEKEEADKRWDALTEGQRKGVAKLLWDNAEPSGPVDVVELTVPESA